jgi:hypothetical protein
LTVARGCGHAPGGTWEKAIPAEVSKAKATHSRADNSRSPAKQRFYGLARFLRYRMICQICSSESRLNPGMLVSGEP